MSHFYDFCILIYQQGFDRIIAYTTARVEEAFTVSWLQFTTLAFYRNRIFHPFKPLFIQVSLSFMKISSLSNPLACQIIHYFANRKNLPTHELVSVTCKWCFSAVEKIPTNRVFLRNSFALPDCLSKFSLVCLVVQMFVLPDIKRAPNSSSSGCLVSLPSVPCPPNNCMS